MVKALCPITVFAPFKCAGEAGHKGDCYIVTNHGRPISLETFQYEVGISIEELRKVLGNGK